MSAKSLRVRFSVPCVFLECFKKNLPFHLMSSFFPCQAVTCEFLDVEVTNLISEDGSYGVSIQETDIDYDVQKYARKSQV